MQQPARTQVVHVGKSREKEQPLDTGRETSEVEQKLAAVGGGLDAIKRLQVLDPAKTEIRLRLDAGDVLHRRERFRALGRIRQIGIEQGEVELHVQGFLVELPRQVHARFRRIDVPVEVQNEIVRHDRIAGGEEGHQPLHQMTLRRAELGREVLHIRREVDLLHRPGVADRVAVHREELRVAHRPQRQVEAGVEQARALRRRAFGGGSHGSHWQASQLPGFSSEHTTATVSLGVEGSFPRGSEAPAALAATVVLAIFVAGRERR